MCSPFVICKNRDFVIFHFFSTTCFDFGSFNFGLFTIKGLCCPADLLYFLNLAVFVVTVLSLNISSPFRRPTFLHISNSLRNFLISFCKSSIVKLLKSSFDAPVGAKLYDLLNVDGKLLVLLLSDKLFSSSQPLLLLVLLLLSVTFECLSIVDDLRVLVPDLRVDNVSLLLLLLDFPV